MRHWSLTPAHPFALQIAADARYSRTDYLDDQVWELHPGAGEAAALTLQTRCGGRAGLASLVPLWLHEGRMIYQALAYARPPVISAFAPAYVQAEAEILSKLALRAEFWAMESHAIGARFRLHNASTQEIRLRLEVFGHVGSGGREQKLGIIALQGGGSALYMGQIGNLHPVVALDNGAAEAAASTALSPKIGAPLVIAAGATVTVRWVHAGLAQMRDSLALALHWLKEDWGKYFARIEEGAAAIPNIETGDTELDATIAAAYMQTLQAFMKPTAHLPHTSFVAARQPARGFNNAADRAWSGQQVQWAYLVALVAAQVEPTLAQGLVRNYLAVQHADGFIDAKPGLGGQRENLLCAPLLARLAWQIYQYTGDKAFLEEVFPRLFQFFERWFAPEADSDGDGFPEWQSERQTGYVYMPTFGVNQSWAQGADIRCFETPDLLAYLLSEAFFLRQMLVPLGKTKYLKSDSEQSRINTRIAALQKHLQSLWQENRFIYRDRDTHTTARGLAIVTDAPGDEEQFAAYQFAPPQRVLVHVLGGAAHTPNIRLTLTGVDASGRPVTESVDSKAFAWKTGRGVYTSSAVFSQLERVRCDGLSRAYRLSVFTPDTTALDINALLPLICGGLRKTDAKTLLKLLKDPAHFWRASGISMNSAADARHDPSNAEGSGGVWPFWLTLLGESLLDYGFASEAAEMLKRLLKTQIAVLKAHKAFAEFYHSDEAKGLGERGHIAGVVPLHLLLRVIGVRVISPTRVWTGGKFAWGKTVTVKHRGVEVRRDKKGTHIEFPSGHRTQLPPDAAWQEVVDPTPAPEAVTPAAVPDPEPPAPTPAPAAAPVTIKIEVEME